MKIVLLDTDTLGKDIDLTPIRQLGDCTEYPTTSANEVEARIKDAEVVIINKVRLNASNLSSAHALKLICVSATGYDNIDTEYCRSAGIALCNVPSYSTDSVAQLTLSMALSLATHLFEYRDFVNSGEYTKSGLANRLSPVYHELSSMTWGIVGGGNIGSRVAAVASAMGCRVLVCRKKEEKVYESATLDEICEKSDIISLHVPLNDETRTLINAERIAKMKDSAILINVSRGAVTDEKALADAITCGKLGGLGVDVYSTEPFPADHPFNSVLGRENVCLTPHMAWGSAEARARCVGVMAKNITAFFGGEELNRIV